MNTLIKFLGVCAVLTLMLPACSSELKDAADLPMEPKLVGPHGEGYVDIESAMHHSKDIKDRLHWQISGCRSCHGAEYTGGQAMKSCSEAGCHVEADGGPEACYTCHGDWTTKKIWPQWYSTHTTHLEGGSGSNTTIECTNCHKLPNGITEPGHIRGVTEVNLDNALARTQTKGTVGEPAYIAADGTCENVYCHGNFTNGNNVAVKWKGTDQGACGTCHGNASTGNPLPKPPHTTSDKCSGCHAGAIDANQVPNKATHMNGVLNVFNQERTDW